MPCPKPPTITSTSSSATNRDIRTGKLIETPVKPKRTDPSAFPLPQVGSGEDHEVKDAHKLTDEETLYILRQYLRSDQLDDPKVIRFIMSYMTNRSQSEAAREAGIPGKGSYLRSRPEIHAVIEALTAKAVQKYGYDASEIIERVKEIALLDLAEFENPDGSFKTHLTQIRPKARRAIKKFKCKNLFGKDANGMDIVIGQLIEVELWDKLKSLELLGREKNIMKETKKIEHDVTSNMKDLLLGSRARAEQRVIAEAMPILEIEGKVEDV